MNWQPAPGPEAESRQAAGELAACLLRREGSKLLASLTRRFGIERLELAEDVVQEALLRALQTWPYRGTPQQPAGWLYQTARHLLLDRLRREQRFREKQVQMEALMEAWQAEPMATEFEDDRLGLMYACCHPGIPREAQAALALKTLCSFSLAEIASAFLVPEATARKRLDRARQKLREAGISLDLPRQEALYDRTEGVLQVLYLLFNEGYKASSGDRLIKAELCREAIGLTSLLATHPCGQQPQVAALLALMWLNASRLPARQDGDGQLVCLQEQDRECWDQAMIREGLAQLQRSATGSQLSTYHLQAAIAAQHCLAGSFADTDWQTILQYYDCLIRLTPTPIIALNRAVALAEVAGPEAGLAQLDELERHGTLTHYYLLYAVRADLEERCGRPAAAWWCRALELCELGCERLYLRKRLATTRR